MHTSTTTSSSGLTSFASTTLCAATTRRPDCTGSTASMLCIRTRRLTALLLVGRSHCLSPCVRSLRLAARLLIVRIAPALLRLCRASGRAVSPLDFSSVGRTGSRHASDHCISRRDYSLSILHRLYCAYAVHPDAPSHHSTFRQSVALALAVCTVIPLCVVTTHLAAATDILRLRRVSGRLGTSRVSSDGSSRRSSTTTSPCARSSSTSSPTPRVRVPWHVARLVTRLIIDYFMSRGSSSTTSPRAGSSSTTSPARVPRHVARLVTRLVVSYFTSRGSSSTTSHRAGSLSTTSPTPHVRVPRHVARRRAPCLAARLRLLRLRRMSGCLGTSRDSSRGASSTTSRHAACRRLLHVTRLVVDYFMSRGSSSTTLPRAGFSSTTSPTPRVRVPQHVAHLVTRLVVDYFTYAARLGVLARRAARRQLLHVARLVVDYFASRKLIVDYFAYATRPGASARPAARLAARRRLLRLCRASGCLGTSRGSSRISLSTTSPTWRVLVPRHVAQLITRLIVDYFTSRGSSRDSSSATSRSAARHRLVCIAQAHCRLLRLRRTSGSLGTSRGDARLISPLAFDYFGYAARPGALARRATRHAARRRLLHVLRLVVDYFTSRGLSSTTSCRAARHRLLCLVQASRQLLRLCRASGCLSTSRVSSCGSSLTTSPTPHVWVSWHVARLVVNYFTSRGSSSTTSPRASSSSTTSPTPRIRVPRHVARLISPLVVDYFAYAARPSASARRVARHASRRRLLRLRGASGCLGTSRG
jgi:hypothetical protein